MAKYRKRVQAGDLCAEVLYTRPEPRDTPQARAAKSKATTAARKALNLRQQHQRLEFLIAANFKVKQCCFVTLTFDSDHLPPDKSSCAKEMKRFIRKVRLHTAKAGKQLKYIYVLEHLHGNRRYHFHMLINAPLDEARELCRMWRGGKITGVEQVSKYGADWCEQLARYMTKERKDARERAWSASKNMDKPNVNGAFTSKHDELTAPDGCFILERREETNSFGSFQYIKYITNSGAPRCLDLKPCITNGHTYRHEKSPAQGVDAPALDCSELDIKLNLCDNTILR